MNATMPGMATLRYCSHSKQNSFIGNRIQKPCRMNGQKKWVKSVFNQLQDSENGPLPSSTGPEEDASKPELTRSTSRTSCRQTHSVGCLNSDKNKNNNWMDEFAPTLGSELAIHIKKLTELQRWLDDCNADKCRRQAAQVCLLTGPSGCGKTAAVRLLAESGKIRLQEWINPVDQEVVVALGDQNVGGSYISSQIDLFKSFLWRASRYKSILDDRNRCLLLVEDFPNALLKDANTFESILEEYVNYGKSPLIFIVTDAKNRDLNISYNLFSDSLKEKLNITHISFNPVSTTLMQKAMKRFCAIMRSPQYTDTYEVPSTAILESIVVNAQGDLRNALINLHFLALKGTSRPDGLQDHTTEVVKKAQHNRQRSRKRKHGSSCPQSLGRDESLTIMHALGRVFNPKYTESRRFLHSPQEIADIFTIEPRTQISLIHANYLSHFSDIDDVVFAANGLSECDVILNEYRDEALALIALNVGVGSVMVANAKPVSGWMPVRGPRHPKRCAPPQIPTDFKHLLPSALHISSNIYATDYSTLVRRIAMKRDMIKA